MTPAVLTQTLDEIERQTLDAGVLLLRQRRKVEPSVIGVAEQPTGEPMLAILPLLDLSQRFALLRNGVTQAKLQGFVFMFDGVVRSLDGTHDALLVVTCTAHSRRARAVLYRNTLDGLAVEPPMEAPDEIAADYQKVFDVHPQPRPA